MIFFCLFFIILEIIYGYICDPVKYGISTKNRILSLLINVKSIPTHKYDDTWKINCPRPIQSPYLTTKPGSSEYKKIDNDVDNDDIDNDDVDNDDVDNNDPLSNNSYLYKKRRYQIIHLDNDGYLFPRFQSLPVQNMTPQFYIYTPSTNRLITLLFKTNGHLNVYLNDQFVYRVQYESTYTCLLYIRKGIKDLIQRGIYKILHPVREQITKRFTLLSWEYVRNNRKLLFSHTKNKNCAEEGELRVLKNYSVNLHLLPRWNKVVLDALTMDQILVIPPTYYKGLIFSPFMPWITSYPGHCRYNTQQALAGINSIYNITMEIKYTYGREVALKNTLKCLKKVVSFHQFGHYTMSGVIAKNGLYVDIRAMGITAARHELYREIIKRTPRVLKCIEHNCIKFNSEAKRDIFRLHSRKHVSEKIVKPKAPAHMKDTIPDEYIGRNCTYNVAKYSKQSADYITQLYVKTNLVVQNAYDTLVYKNCLYSFIGNVSDYVIIDYKASKGILIVRFSARDIASKIIQITPFNPCFEKTLMVCMSQIKLPALMEIPMNVVKFKLETKLRKLKNALYITIIVLLALYLPLLTGTQLFMIQYKKMKKFKK